MKGKSSSNLDVLFCFSLLKKNLRNCLSLKQVIKFFTFVSSIFFLLPALARSCRVSGHPGSAMTCDLSEWISMRALLHGRPDPSGPPLRPASSLGAAERGSSSSSCRLGFRTRRTRRSCWCHKMGQWGSLWRWRAIAAVGAIQAFSAEQTH